MFVANSEFLSNIENSEKQDPYINKRRQINQATDHDYDIVRNKTYIDDQDLENLEEDTLASLN